MAHDLALVWPEILVLFTATGSLVLEMIRRPRWSCAFTVAGLAVATAVAAGRMEARAAVFSGTLRVDVLLVWARVVLAPATALCSLLAHARAAGGEREATLHALLSYGLLGALLLAGAGDVMFLVLGLLLTSLASFALVAHAADDRGTEAALKYFIFGSVSGAILAFAVTFWFGATGSTLLSGLGRLGGHPWAAALGLAGVLAGLGYKAAVVPFHFWAPDAYDGAPVAVAAYLSVVPKTGAIFALAQVLGQLPADGVAWRPAVALLAAISMSWGNLAALRQESLPRLLAYSSIAQAGYFLVGATALGRSAMAVPALIVFAAAYAAMNIGAFAVVAGTGIDRTALAGVGRKAPLTGVAMVCFLLSLVGVPPLAGFAGKLLLFGAAIDARFGWLAVVAILNSVLSLAVYLRIIVPMYARPGLGEAPVRQSPVVAVAGVALAATLFLGVAARLFFGDGPTVARMDAGPRNGAGPAKARYLVNFPIGSSSGW